MLRGLRGKEVKTIELLEVDYQEEVARGDVL